MDKAISMLEFQGIAGLGCLAVEGKTVYFDPIVVLKSFSEAHNKPTRQYLHMVLHCVYRHFWISTLVNRDYRDLACDIAVEYTIDDIDIRDVETPSGSAAAEYMKRYSGVFVANDYNEKEE